MHPETPLFRISPRTRSLWARSTMGPDMFPVAPLASKHARCPFLWAASVVLMGLSYLPLYAICGERYEGNAYAAKSGRLLYRETHWRYEANGQNRQLVLYRCPDGAPFARKTLAESPSAISPDFDFVDGRDGYREGVRTRAGVREVYMQKNGGAPSHAKPLRVIASSVIDAGFDPYVRAQWNNLGNSSATVPFLITSRFEFLDFKISPAGNGGANKGQRVLRMSLGAWYGFAAPSIVLTYDSKNRRLKRFEGIGTIRDARGRYQDTRIEFPDDAIASGASHEEIAKASELPLVRQCAT